MKKLLKNYFVLVFVLTFFSILSLSAQEEKKMEEMHTIQKGDTLWDLSSNFLKDPHLWPKLWQRNPYITNPHWIYPGRQIRLTPLEELKKEEPPTLLKEPEVKKPEPPIEKKIVEDKPGTAPEVKPVLRKTPLFPEVRSAGFFSDKEYHGIGIILESKEGKTLMGEGDIVYLAFKISEPISIGNKYTVFRPSEIIKHHITDKKIGRKYNIVGNIQIIDQYNNFFTAKVIESFQEILRGDMIRPYLEEMEIDKGKK